MYSTRLCCLVYAITCLAQQAQIALSEPMSNIDQQGSSLGTFPTGFSPLSPL